MQEVREHVGFATTKQWTAQWVVRGGPCLLGLFSLVSLIYARLAKAGRPAIRKTAWYDKSEPTFSEGLYAVRRLVCSETVLKQALGGAAVSRLPTRFTAMLVDGQAGVGEPGRIGRSRAKMVSQYRQRLDVNTVERKWTGLASGVFPI